MKSKIIYPDNYSLSARRVGRSGNFTVIYSETFRSKRYLERTAKAVRVMSPHLRVTVHGTVITVRATLALRELANMMIGEFLPKSSIGELSIAKLYEYTLFLSAKLALATH